MSDMEALVYAIGAAFIVGGIAMLIMAVVRKVKAHNRAMRQAERKLGVMYDLKDLNS
jgi:uncharacterized membrane protein HdeD (DUF308 family)